MLYPVISQAQFNDANQNDNSNSVVASAQNTGNDVLYDAGDVYRVSVWSDTGGRHPGLSWNVDYGIFNYQNKLYFQADSTVIHADVCLLKNSNGTVFALAAYHFQYMGPFWVVEVYEWTGSTFAYNGNATDGGSWGTAMNIDGDDNGNFMVVYDDANQDIWAMAGYMDNSPTLNMYNSGNPISIDIVNTNGIFPDVSLYHDGGGYETAHMSYIDPNNGRMYVNDYDFTNDIKAGVGTISSTPMGVLPPNSMNFIDCRIASPNSSGNVSDWTVIVVELDHMGTYFIEGYNNNSGSTPIYYNDGTAFTGAPDLSSFPNVDPVETYDDAGLVWVGWTFDNITGNMASPSATAIIPLVFPCDGAARVPGTISEYWEGPKNLSSNDAVGLLSLSGRYANSTIWSTYWNVGNSYIIFTKEIATSASEFRNEAENELQPVCNAFEHAINSMESEGFHLLLYDVKGSLLSNTKGKSMDDIRYVFKTRKTECPQLCIARFFSNDGKINISKKIILSN